MTLEVQDIVLSFVFADMFLVFIYFLFKLNDFIKKIDTMLLKNDRLIRLFIFRELDLSFEGNQVLFENDEYLIISKEPRVRK